jgi:voltage-gated potassium channel
MALIAANVAAVVLATVDPLYLAYRPFFRAFELLSVAVFSLEYVGRVWSCVEDPEFERPVVGRLRFAVQPYLVVDLLAILPFFMTNVLDLRFLRVLRLLRFARLFKFARYSESMRTFGRVAREKRSDLVVSLFATGILLTIASSLMYFAEHGAQPDAFSSIPASLWWGVVTLTTVGYGDVTPVTPLGRLLGGAIALLGVGLVALPASILASGFVEEATERDYCPHCGEPLDGHE